MKTDCFYVFQNKPVAIVEMLPDNGGRKMAKIRHIQRKADRHGNISDTEEMEDVFCDCLIELTHKVADDLIKKYYRTIGECNMRIHALNECLSYME